MSEGLLNSSVPVTPAVVLPLAALLFAAAAAVGARGLGRGGRRSRLLFRAVTGAVAIGLMMRGLIGLVWVCGIGADTHSAFYVLNLALYTPACLGFGAVSARLAGFLAHRA